MEEYDVVIIGLGPAGYAAGIYATRFNMKTLLIGKEPG
ncbi:MAG TPA: NAD(P)/FAD-dependent oxidoreductase, partial [Methanomicrobia archaeon]|nr:NAD(P)/FAD-dependent oxidoreductase [Methanomicrobia archaeon]